MIENGKINDRQLFFLTMGFLFGGTSIFHSVGLAGTGAWLSESMGIMAGVILALMMVYLAKRFPSQTLIQYTQVLFGKPLGKLVGLLYLWYFFHLAAIELRDLGEFMNTAIMPETPIVFFFILMALVSAYLVSQRLEVMARLSVLMFPVWLVFTSTVITFGLYSGLFKLQNLLPLLDHSGRNIILGAWQSASFPYGEIILLTMVMPYVNTSKMGKAMVTAVIFSGMYFLAIITGEIMAFGSNTATITFPSYAFIETLPIQTLKLTPLVLLIWFMEVLVKLSVCLYAFLLGLAQWLNLKDFKFLILPVTILVVAVTTLIYDSTIQLINFSAKYYPVYAFPYEFGLPVLMFILAWWKKGKKKSVKSVS